MRNLPSVLLVGLALTGPAAAVDPQLLAGKRLALTDGHGNRRTAQLLATDAGLTLGRGNDSPDDPVAHGGTLRIVSFHGDVFDDTYPLPAAGWRYLGGSGQGKGYRFHAVARSPVRSLVVKSGGTIAVEARGRRLGHSLAANPDPVEVVLTLGEQSYCLTFSAGDAFRTKKRWTAGTSTAPTVCPLDYASDALWLCRPGMEKNQCLVNSIDATFVHPDGSTSVETHTGSEDHPFDCFYVYPTVDLSGPVGNHTDFSDVSYQLDPLLSQAARLNGTCRIFAPLYRQITLGTYGAPDAAHYIDIAYGDVEDAFRRYLAEDNGGRNLVIMGHSQGTQMVTRLMQNLVDPDPALRARLVTALLIGGGVTVPEGGTVGGTFQNIPLCTSAEQTGCVIAYRTYAEGFPPTGTSNTGAAPGMDNACTNPVALGGTSEGRFTKSYFPNAPNQPAFRVVPPTFTTAFTLFTDFYTGACVKDANGHSYLEIRVRPLPGDVRTNPIPFNFPLFAPSFLGTHVLDYNWAMADLVTLVQTKAARMP